MTLIYNYVWFPCYDTPASRMLFMRGGETHNYETRLLMLIKHAFYA